MILLPHLYRGRVYKVVVSSATVATLRIFGYGVMAVASPGVAAADAANAHPEAPKNAPFPNGLDHVVGAGRLIAAVAPE